MAKILQQNGIDIGGARLYEWLRDNGYICRRKGYNEPTQKAMNLGVLRIKESVITHSDGTKEIKITPKVTTKGQKYFVNKFLNKEVVNGRY